MPLPAEITKKTKITTPIFRVSYPHIWTPQKSEDGNSDIYGVTAIFDDTADLSEMKKLALAIRTQKFGKDGKFKKTFRYEDEFDLKKNPEYKGKIIVAMRSYNRPVAVVKRNPSVAQGQKGWLKNITDQSEFYAGCYAIAAVVCYDFNHPKGGKGVAFGLQNLIKVKDGEPLVGSSNPEDDFDEIDTSLFDDGEIDNSTLMVEDFDDL